MSIVLEYLVGSIHCDDVVNVLALSSVGAQPASQVAKQDIENVQSQEINREETQKLKSKPDKPVTFRDKVFSHYRKFIKVAYPFLIMWISILYALIYILIPNTNNYWIYNFVKQQWWCAITVVAYVEIQDECMPDIPDLTYIACYVVGFFMPLLMEIFVYLADIESSYVTIFEVTASVVIVLIFYGLHTLARPVIHVHYKDRLTMVYHDNNNNAKEESDGSEHAVMTMFDTFNACIVVKADEDEQGDDGRGEEEIDEDEEDHDDQKPAAEQHQKKEIIQNPMILGESITANKKRKKKKEKNKQQSAGTAAMSQTRRNWLDLRRSTLSLHKSTGLAAHHAPRKSHLLNNSNHSNNRRSSHLHHHHRQSPVNKQIGGGGGVGRGGTDDNNDADEEAGGREDQHRLTLMTDLSKKKHRKDQDESEEDRDGDGEEEETKDNQPKVAAAAPGDVSDDERFSPRSSHISSSSSASATTNTLSFTSYYRHTTAAHQSAAFHYHQLLLLPSSPILSAYLTYFTSFLPRFYYRRHGLPAGTAYGDRRIQWCLASGFNIVFNIYYYFLMFFTQYMRTNTTNGTSFTFQVGTFTVYVLCASGFRIVLKRLGLMLDQRKIGSMSMFFVAEFMGLMFYYAFYRILFDSITSWYLFIAFQILHLCSEWILYPARCSTSLQPWMLYFQETVPGCQNLFIPKGTDLNDWVSFIALDFGIRVVVMITTALGALVLLTTIDEVGYIENALRQEGARQVQSAAFILIAIALEIINAMLINHWFFRPKQVDVAEKLLHCFSNLRYAVITVVIASVLNINPMDAFTTNDSFNGLY